MSRAVVIFARAPEVEAAVKGLPNAFAALFDRNAAAWLRDARAAGATSVISCAPSARVRFDAIALGAAHCAGLAHPAAVAPPASDKCPVAARALQNEHSALEVPEAANDWPSRRKPRLPSGSTKC